MSLGQLRRRALAAAALAALPAAACGDRNPNAVIGFGFYGAVRQLAQQTIDSTTHPGMPTIIVSRGSQERVLEVGKDDHWLVASIDQASRLIADDGLVAVVGPVGSRDALLTGPMYRAHGIPYVMPTANSPQLANLGPGAFRLAPSLDEEGTFIAEHVARRLNARTATVLYVPDEWGVALQTAVAGGLWFHGVTVLARSPVPLDGDCHADPTRIRDALAAALRRGTPDVIVLALRNPESECLIAEAERLAPNARFVGGDGTVFTQAFLNDAGWAASRVYTVAFWDPLTQDSAARAFAERFRAVAGTPPSYVEGLTYDAVMLLATAIRTVGPDRRAVRRYLESLGRQRAPYRGVTGEIDFRTPRASRLTMLRASRYAERWRMAAAPIELRP